MSTRGSFPAKAGAFAICTFAASSAAAATILVLSGSWSRYLGDALLGLSFVMLLVLPVVTLSGLLVALPLEHFVLSRASLPLYLAISVMAAWLAGWGVEALIFRSPYIVTGSLLIPAVVAGGVSAGLWHLLVRKRKVSTHG